jgi:tryptophanyl-tRNA synthetase
MADLLADHYRTLREERGFEAMDYTLGGLPESYVRQAFACAEHGRAFAEGVDAGKRSLVTVGVTPTGPPHIGTLGQLLTAIRFQRAGFDVQVVIADLAAYTAAGRDLEAVRVRARRYESFARTLGFDADEGVLRTQEADYDALHTAQLLARYYGDYGEDATEADGGDDQHGDADDEDGDDSEPTAFEEALERAYEDADTPGEATTDFAGQSVGLLLVTDSLHPIVKEGYENVALVVGADNAGLAGRFVEVLGRSPYEATVAGLYTKLVAGLNGYPKLSKSLPESQFTLADDPETIRDAVLDTDRDADDPGESIPFQMMQLASEFEPAELGRLAEVCEDGGEVWAEAKREYADYLVEIGETWK